MKYVKYGSWYFYNLKTFLYASLTEIFGIKINKF